MLNPALQRRYATAPIFDRARSNLVIVGMSCRRGPDTWTTKLAPIQGTWRTTPRTAEGWVPALKRSMLQASVSFFLARFGPVWTSVTFHRELGARAKTAMSIASGGELSPCDINGCTGDKARHRRGQKGCDVRNLFSCSKTADWNPVESGAVD